MTWIETIKTKASVAADFLKARSGGMLGKLLMMLAIVALVSHLWNTYKPVSAPVNQWTPAPEIKEVVKIQKVYVKGPERIVTIEKEKIVEKFKLPDEIAKNPDEQVIATATKFSRYLYIIVVVKNGLLHMQLISVCIQQRVQNRRSELCHRCAVASSHWSV